MSNNFDLRKFLTENNLTTTAKAINEAPNMPPVPGSKPNMPPVPGNKPKMPPVPGQASKPDGTKMNPEMFAKFKEALANKALREYGDLGRLIESGEYFVPEPPAVTDYDLINDPFGLNKATYLE